MPTILPPRREPAPPRPESGVRPILLASVLLLGVLVLVCGKFYPPVPGYSLAGSHSDLQLSP